MACRLVTAVPTAHCFSEDIDSTMFLGTSAGVKVMSPAEVSLLLCANTLRERKHTNMWNVDRDSVSRGNPFPTC